MGPFEKVNFHICGSGGDIVSKLISGGGKRSSYLSNCVTVNIVTDDAEEDVFDKMRIELCRKEIEFLSHTKKRLPQNLQVFKCTR